ncbi:MAG: hypothetical protein GC192_23585 [Bacteroidetes bacterium]|nr:hypothetical protein [Bacteroidota bacterium]
MEAVSLVLAIGGIIIGALASYLASRHFFKKGVKEKLLTPYLQFTSKLFSELEPDLKENLIVRYKNHKVENITQAQFLIANDGDIPIRDIIEPLKLTLPKENKIFSANLIHVEPEGREIQCTIIENEEKNIIQFNLPLLNSGEYFIVKIVIQDSIPMPQKNEDESQKKELFNFSITADDLPPNLRISHLPYSYYEQEKEEKYNWTGVWVATISGLITTFLAGIIFAFKSNPNGLYLFSFRDFFSKEHFCFYSICIIVLAIVSLGTLLFTVVGTTASLMELTPNEKPKFKVPNRLKKEEKKVYPFDYFN